MESILIYAVIILFVTYFFWLADKNFEKNHKQKGMVLAFIGIIVASFFSGIRHDVGTDWLQFSSMYEQAHYANSFSDYAKQFYQIEKGYLFLNYSLSRIIPSKYLFMGICTGITMTFSFLALYKLREKLSLCFGMFLFMMNYYLYSFNIIRQSLSVSIALLGISLILSNVPLKKVIILFIISILIHYSSIIIIIFLALYYLENSKLKLKLFYKTIFYSLLISSFFTLKYIVAMIVSMGFIRYEFYSTVGNYGIDITALSKGLIILTIVTILRQKLKTINQNDDRVLYNMMIIWIIFSQLSSLIPFLSRISLLFGFSTLLYLPQLIKSIKYNKERFLVESIFVCVYVFFWLYEYGYRGYAEVIPYKTIFGI